MPRTEFEEWAGDRKTFRMEEFYRAQRRRFDVLMEGGEPVSGRWNYDHENREPPPKGRATLGVVDPWQPSEDEIDQQVRDDLDALDLPTIGRDGPRWFAVTAEEARRALAHFVHHRLPHFGPPEDAMLHDDWTMAHSLLSVPLNLGLLASARRRSRGRVRLLQRGRPDRQRRGLHPAGARLAGVHLAPVLALRP